MISSRLHIHIPLWQRNCNRLVTSVKASSGTAQEGIYCPLLSPWENVLIKQVRPEQARSPGIRRPATRANIPILLERN